MLGRADSILTVFFVIAFFVGGAGIGWERWRGLPRDERRGTAIVGLLVAGLFVYLLTGPFDSRQPDCSSPYDLSRCE